MERSLVFAWASLLAWTSLVLTPASVESKEIFLVGSEDRPWSEFGTTPGGVIAYVEALGDVRDLADEPVFVDVPDSLGGWLMPLRLSPEFNISSDVLERGGSIDVPILARSEVDPAQLEGVLNGDHAVAYDRKFVAGRIVRNNGITIRLDLGARFGVDRIVFYPRMTEQFPFVSDYLRGYEIYLNDGQPQNLFASGQPIFTSPILREPDNRQARVDVGIEAQFVRYLELKSISPLGFEIDEIEVYGRGFVPTARYVSNVLDLGEDVVWGQINWNEIFAGNASDSELEIRVRSGSDTTPDIYYRTVSVDGVSQLLPTNSNGDTLTEASYMRLKENERGPIRVDIANWSQWQLAGNGVELNVPAPRRYFQFSIDFTNRDLTASRAVADLGFEYEKPPVDKIIAEIGPAQTQVGEETTFTYFARVVNATGRTGFSRFEVETPARVAAVRSVEIFDAQGSLLESADFSAVNLDALPAVAGALSIEEVAGNRFALGLPQVSADGALLKIVFDAAVFRYGTRFQGRAFADANTAIPLQTEGGNATADLQTDELLVRVTVGSQVAGALSVVPQIFTPNGDGINDAVQISYTVLHLLEPSPAAVRVYDLAGRVVRQFDAVQVQNGRSDLGWDGKDDGGQQLPPGTYIVQVEISSDSSTESRAHSVVVAY
jgi:gliding motility-associated-like protein